MKEGRSAADTLHDLVSLRTKTPVSKGARKTFEIEYCESAGAPERAVLERSTMLSITGGRMYGREEVRGLNEGGQKKGKQRDEKR